MIRKQDDLLGTLIHDVAHALRLDIDQRVKPFKLTRVKWLALGIIDDHPGITQAELANKLELGSAAVGRLVDRLVERDFVERSPDPDDRRAYQLEVKPNTKHLFAELDGISEEMRKSVLDGLSRHELDALNAGLSKVRDNLRKLTTTGTAAMIVIADNLAAASPQMAII